MAIILNGFEECNFITRALEGVGTENRDFFGPWNGTSEASANWAKKSWDDDVELLKTIKYRAINTGTLLVTV